MINQDIISDILMELKRAKKLHSFPDHIVARAAIVGEEAGELIKAARSYKYSQFDETGDEEKLKHMEHKATQIAAYAIRFIQSLKNQ